MKLKRIFAVAIVALTAVFLMPHMPSGVVSAHHSDALYGDKLVDLDGTVVEFRWRNPHVTVVWDVKDASGKVVRWRGEMASVTTVMSHGLTKDSLKPGDSIRFRIYPAKTGSPESVIMHMLRPDGSVLLGWSQQAGGSPERRAQRQRENAEQEPPR